jgi:hypothetical protein
MYAAQLGQICCCIMFMILWRDQRARLRVEVSSTGPDFHTTTARCFVSASEGSHQVTIMHCWKLSKTHLIRM